MPVGHDERFEIPIQELSLTSNVRDRLEHRGYLLVGHLLMVAPDELETTPGLGRTVLDQVRAALAELGFGKQVQRAAG
jgi:DNA-directed RNA polymerase alpha subunit